MHFVNLSMYFQVNLELKPRKLPKVTQSTWGKSSLSPEKALPQA